MTPIRKVLDIYINDKEGLLEALVEMFKDFENNPNFEAEFDQANYTRVEKNLLIEIIEILEYAIQRANEIKDGSAY